MSLLAERFYGRLKRVMDVVGASIALLLVALIMVLVALALWVENRGPVLFSQRRPGLRGEVFLLRKFRTMTNARDERGELLPDAERLTPLGCFLRRTSLDELPQFWNVLRGEMSLVGPRPLLESYLPLYSPEQARRHDVRPGITGWAQVNGRNAVDWEARFALDVWYVERLSLGLDLLILFRTLARVFSGSDVSAQGNATMPPFRGSLS